jgi:hypothetical protein
MDTKAKFGLSKRNAIFLFVQMIFTILGFAAQIGIMIFLIANGLDTFMLISSISILLAFVAIFAYGIYGYKKSNAFYYCAIAFFLFAILMNNILPFRDTFQKILLTMLFGAFAAFILAQKNFKLSLIVVCIASLLSLVFSIYSSVTANVNSLGPIEQNVLPAIMMYVSIWTPVIISLVFAATTLAREEKKAQ